VALLAIRNATHCMHVLSPAPPVPVQLYVGIKVGRPESQKKHMHCKWVRSSHDLYFSLDSVYGQSVSSTLRGTVFTSSRSTRLCVHSRVPE